MTLDQQRFQALLSAVPDGVQENDLEGRITYSNHHHHEMLGYAPGELLGMSIFDLIHGEGKASELNDYLALLVKEQPEPTPYFAEAKCKDGSPLPTKVTWRYVRDDEGTLTGFISIISNMSDHHALEEKLRLERDRTCQYLDVAQFMMVGLDQAGNINLINRKAGRVLGYEPEQLLGQNWFHTRLPPTESESALSLFKQIIAGKEEALEHYENHVLTATGEKRLIAWHNTIYKDSQGNICGTISSGEDITQRRQNEKERAHLQEELRRSQKMEAVGRLTAGIAHDFNNILASILGYADLAADTISQSDDEELKRYLKEVVTEGEKARDLIKQMLTFTRANPGEESVLPPLPLIKETIKSLELSLSDSIQVNLSNDESVPNILMSPSHLHQVVLNVLTNAIEAIGSAREGHIDINIGEKSIAQLPCNACNEVINGNYLEICINDDGDGIASATLEKIFSPLFSTKESHTGMGLTSSQGILHDHDGHILVESMEAYGTSVRLLIPPADVASAQRIENSTAANHQTSANILIVDDEESIAQLKGELLTAQGWQVDVHSDSIMALQSFEQQPDKYDCALIKRDLPSLNGTDLSLHLLLHRPDLPIVLFVPERDASDHHALYKLGIRHVATKPIEPERLTALIKQFIDQSQ